MRAPLPAGCRERWVQAGGLRMYAVEAGDPQAPLVVLLHGFPEFWYSWRQQLVALAVQFHVVAPDLRGYGQTDKPATGYDIPSLAADIDALLAALTADDARPRQVTLVGHDWGGVVAWSTASLLPQRFHRLVVLDAPHPYAYLQSLRHNPGQLRRSWYIAMFQIRGLFEWQFRRDPQRMMARMLRANAVQKHVFSREEIGHYADAMADPEVLPRALAYYRQLPAAFRHMDALRTPVTMPVLVLWGARDPALGTELIEACRTVCKGAFSAQIWPDAGHWLQQEQPEGVSEAIRAFAAGDNVLAAGPGAARQQEEA